MVKKYKIKKEEVIEQVFHIYDFLVRCRINRVQHEIFHKKYEGSGMKTLVQWEEITKLKSSS